MTRTADDEWLDGYRDGGDDDVREPGANRSHSYRLGFHVRRHERKHGSPLAPAAELRRLAEEAERKDRP
jgi:hypothetical protein